MKKIILIFFATLMGYSHAHVPLQQMDPLFVEQKVNHVQRVAFLKKAVGIGFAAVTTVVLTATMYMFLRDQFDTREKLPLKKEDTKSDAVQSDSAIVSHESLPVSTVAVGQQAAVIAATSFTDKALGFVNGFFGAIKSGVQATVKQVPLFFVQATLAPVANFFSQKIFSKMNAQWALGNNLIIGNKIVYKMIGQDIKEVVQTSGDIKLAKKNILFSAYMLNPDEKVQFEEKSGMLSFIDSALQQSQAYYDNSFAINMNSLVDSLGQLIGLMYVKVRQGELRQDAQIIADEIIDLTNAFTAHVTSMREQHNYSGLLNMTISFLALTEDKIQTFMHLEG